MQLSDISRILKGIKNNDPNVNHYVASEVGHRGIGEESKEMKL